MEGLESRGKGFIQDFERRQWVDCPDPGLHFPEGLTRARWAEPEAVPAGDAGRCVDGGASEGPRGL